MVTAVKKHEDSEGTVLRCYEAEGHDTDAEIEWMGQRYALHFARHEVKTLLLGGEKAEELLFTEYAE